MLKGLNFEYNVVKKRTFEPSHMYQCEKAILLCVLLI
jgi:hypothetical protein